MKKNFVILGLLMFGALSPFCVAEESKEAPHDQKECPEKANSEQPKEETSDKK